MTRISRRRRWWQWWNLRIGGRLHIDWEDGRQMHLLVGDTLRLAMTCDTCHVDILVYSFEPHAVAPWHRWRESVRLKAVAEAVPHGEPCRSLGKQTPRKSWIWANSDESHE